MNSGLGVRDANGDTLTALPSISAGTGSSPGQQREKERNRNLGWSNSGFVGGVKALGSADGMNGGTNSSSGVSGGSGFSGGFGGQAARR